MAIHFAHTIEVPQPPTRVFAVLDVKYPRQPVLACPAFREREPKASS